jgi:hypothetical protein
MNPSTIWDDQPTTAVPSSETAARWLKRGTRVSLGPGTVIEHVPDTSSRVKLLDTVELPLGVDTMVYATTTAMAILNQNITFDLAQEAHGRANEEDFVLPKVLYNVPRYTIIRVLEAAAGSTWDGPVDGEAPSPSPPDEEPPPESPPPAPTPPAKANWVPWIVAGSVALVVVGAVAVVIARGGRRRMRGMGSHGGRGKVLLTKAQALRLLDWHGGQGTATYALGSSSFAGHGVDIGTAEAVLSDLSSLASDGRHVSAREQASLRSLYTAVQHAISKAGAP